MVLRHVIICVAHIRKGGKNILFDMLIHVLDCTTLIFRIKRGLGFCHIRYAKIGTACLRVVVLAEDIDKHEMSVCPAKQSLGHLSLQTGLRTTEIIDFGDSGIGGSNAFIAVVPEILRRIVILIYNLLPIIKLLYLSCRTGDIVSEILYIVRHILCDGQICNVRVCRNKKVLDLFLSIYNGSLIRSDIKKSVARSNCRYGKH